MVFAPSQDRAGLVAGSPGRVVRGQPGGRDQLLQPVPAAGYSVRPGTEPAGAGPPGGRGRAAGKRRERGGGPPPGPPPPTPPRPARGGGPPRPPPPRGGRGAP